MKESLSSRPEANKPAEIITACRQWLAQRDVSGLQAAVIGRMIEELQELPDNHLSTKSELQEQFGISGKGLRRLLDSLPDDFRDWWVHEHECQHGRQARDHGNLLAGRQAENSKRALREMKQRQMDLSRQRREGVCAAVAEEMSRWLDGGDIQLSTNQQLAERFGISDNSICIYIQDLPADLRRDRRKRLFVQNAQNRTVSNTPQFRLSSREQPVQLPPEEIAALAYQWLDKHEYTETQRQVIRHIIRELQAGPENHRSSFQELADLFGVSRFRIRRIMESMPDEFRGWWADERQRQNGRVNGHHAVETGNLTKGGFKNLPKERLREIQQRAQAKSHELQTDRAQKKRAMVSAFVGEEIRRLQQGEDIQLSTNAQLEERFGMPASSVYVYLEDLPADMRRFRSQMLKSQGSRRGLAEHGTPFARFTAEERISYGREAGKKGFLALLRERYEYGGRFFPSMEEAACGTLLARYLPGFSLEDGRTHQVDIGSGFADFYDPAGDTILEYHRIKLFHVSDRAAGDFASREEYEEFQRQMTSFGEDARGRREYKQSVMVFLLTRYTETRRRILDNGPYAASRLVVCCTPKEFCRFLSTVSGGIPADDLLAEFATVMDDVREQHGHDSEAENDSAKF